MIRSMNGAPMFFGNNYEMWKVRMNKYLGSIGCDVWRSMITGYTPPKKVRTTTHKDAKKNNSMEMEIILD